MLARKPNQWLFDLLHETAEFAESKKIGILFKSRYNLSVCFSCVHIFLFLYCVVLLKITIHCGIDCRF